jgi:endonuclease/exonuclease/phosphatase family metal-dependent hydrolase
VGDFNAVARQNRAYEILTSKNAITGDQSLVSNKANPVEIDRTHVNGLTDTWYAARERRNETANSFTGFGPLLHEGKRIDWILARGAMDVRATEAVTMRPGGQWPSDHLAIMAWVTLTPPAA